MKMAENSVLAAFQNNRDSINSNCVEVKGSINEKIVDNDVTMPITTNSQSADEPNAAKMDVVTQEDAVEEFLAGENKNGYGDEIVENLENEGEENIEFKADHVTLEGGGCLEFENTCDDENSKMLILSKVSGTQYLARSLKRRSIKCLNKMHIMEDVKEGCDTQPSSPGHADQSRTDDNAKEAPQKCDEIQKNGISDDKLISEIKFEEHDLTEMEENPAENSASNHLSNEENSADGSERSNKRKQDDEESTTKRLRMEIQENFLSRDRIFNEFMEIVDNGNTEQLQNSIDQTLAEIKTLNDLAKEKEKEWNNIIYLKKMKEEFLLRIQRRKQMVMMNQETLDAPESNRNGGGHSILKSNLTNASAQRLRVPSIDGRNQLQNRHRSILPKATGSNNVTASNNVTVTNNVTVSNNADVNGSLDLRQGGRQRPVLDVQSIIADYRQRHPETVPRRGRRIRSSPNDRNSNIMNFASLALHSGAQVKHMTDIPNELGLLLSGAAESGRLDGGRLSGESGENQHSFKDMLVQFAKMSQSERNEFIQNAFNKPPPPPYPEVTVHPVPTTSAAPSNSLLHGILTKSPSKPNNKTSFSPTLARLLTAPERNNSHLPHSSPGIRGNVMNQSDMSISEILSTNKARNEITITPVSQYDGRSIKVDDEEAEDSADRLVIDEGKENADARKSDDSEGGDEVPQCQGCNEKPAQFVCAGCGNQWYCSRECQVSAWDEHSELCSG